MWRRARKSHTGGGELFPVAGLVGVHHHVHLAAHGAHHGLGQRQVVLRIHVVKAHLDGAEALFVELQRVFGALLRRLVEVHGGRVRFHLVGGGAPQPVERLPQDLADDVPQPDFQEKQPHAALLLLEELRVVDLDFERVLADEVGLGPLLDFLPDARPPGCHRRPSSCPITPWSVKNCVIT